jgi:NAD(P)H-quinone oxidoreductase subunit 5
MQPTLFNFDSLAQIVAILVIFNALVIGFFAKEYLKGDRNYKFFFVNIIAIITSIIACFSSDDIYFFLAFWYLSNALLVFLIIHKPSWNQAYTSGILAAKNFLGGFILLFIAIFILSKEVGSTSISQILYNAEIIDNEKLIIALSLITISAFLQSAIYPFHQWLISSLNSPTPVSAIMHAGLINGGGILLAKFAPLYFEAPTVMEIIFIFGITTAIIGSAWKLIQSDVKKMLACSTMSQMGFMIAQCGLGLFAAAIAHLFYHGMFKAYLFLSSNSAHTNKKLDLGFPPKLASFFCACLVGILGALSFAITSRETLNKIDSTAFLVFMSFIASTQLALNFLEKISLKNLLNSIVTAVVLSAVYGYSIFAIEFFLYDLHLFQPQELKPTHLVAAIIITMFWLARLFFKNQKIYHPLLLKLYVRTLNASQPHPKTITTNRKNYRL